MRKLLEDFFRLYLTERNLDDTLAMTTDNVISIGTGEHEIAKGKSDLRELLKGEFAEIPDSLDYKITDYTEMEIADNVRTMLVKLTVNLEYEGQVTELKTRLSCTCVKINEEWKFSCFHMSTPTSDQEKNKFFPLHFGTRTAGKLTTASDSKLLELISQSIPGGIMGGYLEEGYPLYAINDKMLDILGYTYEELIEATDEKMINTIYAGDQDRVQASIIAGFQAKGEYQLEYRAVGKDYRIIWVHDIGRKIITEDGRHAMISIITDISERKEREHRLKVAAEHDYLTKLYNRKAMRRRIEHEFQKDTDGILFICDIDHFKSVNDTKGHVIGDACLMQLANIIRQRKGPAAIAGRLGGDEYILFFPSSVNQHDALTIMEQIQEEFYDYMQVLAPELNVSLSAGFSVRENEESLDSLYEKADKALYQIKRLRR